MKIFSLKAALLYFEMFRYMTQQIKIKITLMVNLFLVDTEECRASTKIHLICQHIPGDVDFRPFLPTYQVTRIIKVGQFEGQTLFPEIFVAYI